MEGINEIRPPLPQGCKLWALAFRENLPRACSTTVRVNIHLSVCQSVSLSICLSLKVYSFIIPLSLSLSPSFHPPPPHPPPSVKVDWMTTRYVILFTSCKTLKYRNRQIRWQCCANRNSQIRWQCCANRNSQIRWQCYANRMTKSNVSVVPTVN